MYFPREQIDHLYLEYQQIHQKLERLQQQYVTYDFQNDHAREYASQGVARRLGTLVRCIDNVFSAVPPDQEDIPDRPVVIDATINIQSFVLNIFGCCDNLAWMWVLERPVLNSDGTTLDPRLVGLTRSCRKVRRSFSNEFRQCLIRRNEWFDHIKNFRDSLAHRIPLYIPPYVVPQDRVDDYQRLEVEAREALRRGNLEEYEQLTEAQMALVSFRPWMTHSPTEQAPTVIFHPQLLADFNTVCELSDRIFEELES